MSSSAVVSGIPHVRDDEHPTDEPLTRTRAERLTDWLIFGVPYLVAVAVSILALPAGHSFSIVAPVGLLLLLVSLRLELLLSVGWVACTQAAFVFLLFVVPLNLVPLAAFVCFVAARLGKGHGFLDTVRAGAASSWYALAAPVVLALLAPGAASWRHWPAYVAAFGGQFLLGTVIVDLRYIRAGKQLVLSEEIVTVILDAALTPIGLAAAVALGSSDFAAVTIMIGITVLLGLTARERGLRLVESQRALRDPLTGLANRALFEETGRGSEARCRRSGQHAALVLLDLDDFKPVNDSLGHQAGDEVLCLFADGLRRVTRTSDLPARVGGDEFAIILVEPIDLAGAQQVVENLRTQLSGTVRLPSGPAVVVRFSAGISLVGGETPWRDATVHADAALYDDKRARKAERIRT